MNKAKTADEFYNKVCTFLNENITFLFNLKWRWEDEKEYEDFTDYKVAIVKKLQEYGLRPFRITKSFTIKFLYEDKHIIELKLLKSGEAKITMTFQ